MPTAAATSESITVAESRPPGLREVAEEESFVPPRRSRWMLIIMGATVIVSGTGNAILCKYMNKRFLPPGPGREPRFFEAPWMQSYDVYLGELICLIVYYADRLIHKSRGLRNTFDTPSSDKSLNKPKCPLYWWLLPTSLDMLSGTLINYGAIFLQTSTVQMLKNLNVIIAAVLSVVVLRKVISCWQWLGVGILTAGLSIVGLYAFFNPDLDNNYDSRSVMGIVMCVSGAAVSAIQTVGEELLFRRYCCPPLLGVGIMGIFGTLLGLVPLFLGEFVGFEKSSETLYMMFAIPPKENQQLALANIMFILSVAFFNGSGLMVTKLGSGLLRTILIAARTFCVWVVELLLKWSVFTALNFVGLAVLLIGVVVYNWGSRLQTSSGSCKSNETSVCYRWGGGTSEEVIDKVSEVEISVTAQVEGRRSRRL